VSARQFARDTQSETVSRSLLVAPRTVKALENVWRPFRRDSRPIVADTDLHDVIMLFGPIDIEA
jgi:hypothetical protein